MEFFLIILLLISIIGLSNFINHFLPYIPVPLIQIVLGVSLAALPVGIHVELEPELFFVLFIAPLLFYDGKNVSRHELWKLRKPILMLALGLVFLTVLVIGYLIHWLIPSIPLSAAFALAAILSPTDVVAVGAISSRVKIPKTITHILEGEGLMNDASGLVAFKFAVAATVTGVFSLAEASVSFIWIALGGFLGGALLAYLIIQLKVYIRRLGMEDVTLHMLIQLLTPFVIFYVIEHFHLSGILSVVAAGIVHGIFKDREQSPAIQLQVVSKSTWTMVIFILNGLVFVLLGLQIPSVSKEIFESPLFNNYQVIIYIFIITAALLILRWLWIYLAWWIGWFMKEEKLTKPSLRYVAITTIAGVRGAVTLAGAFTIPYFLANGDVFPQRALIIFIAAGVILVTLVLASMVLPLLAKTDKGKTEEAKEDMENLAKLRSAESAINTLRELTTDENRSASVSIIANYNQIRNQLLFVSDEEAARLDFIETTTRMKVLDVESAVIEKLKFNNEIDRESLYLIEEHIHRMRVAVTNRTIYRGLLIWTVLKRGYYNLLRLIIHQKHDSIKKRILKGNKVVKLKVEMARAAIKYLRQTMTAENEIVNVKLIGEYNDMIVKFKLANNLTDSRHYMSVQRELRDKAFQAERDEIQRLYESGEITLEITREMRRHINIREAYWMEETSIHSH
ncbi:Na+/H+ antiporter [Psychrobacillus antarcticus]|uniref:Na+/H+ antiporter n=1 Tax=Psychrobacillus antarcticus TaxID=2879115 RepID=UPI0024087829|nr:Na+/H+ antiporter [Psychrobacillus antarcticus]